MDRIVIGVDVGGPRKGFHAVALNGRKIIDATRSTEVSKMAQWCTAQSPSVIAIDAPCFWRSASHVRAAEREMAAQGIACYYAPTEQRAREHAFYRWMLPGRTLFDVLSGKYPMYLGGEARGSVCIETFPHAVSCALAGKVVSAKQKRTLRRELLELSGISTARLVCIDEIDAALCAVAADSFVRGEFKSYGNADGGFIIVPARAAGKVTS